MLLVSSIQHDQYLSHTSEQLETISVSVCLHNSKQLITVSASLPPASTMSWTELGKIFSACDYVLPVGDLNSKHVAWNCASVDANGKTLLTYSITHNIPFHFQEHPTHFPHNSYPNILNITIAKSCPVTKPLSASALSSDHNPNVSTSPPARSKPSTTSDNRNTNWQPFQSTLQNNLPLHPTIHYTINLEQAVTDFEAAIRQATTIIIPLHKAPKKQITLPPSLLYLLKLR
jgi:hypothetical protein